MKLLNSLLPLAAVSTAFVVPDEELTSQIVIQSQKDSQTFFDRLQGNAEDLWSGVEETFKHTVAFSENAIDNAMNAATGAAKDAKSTFECHASMTKFDISGWLNSALPVSTMDDMDIFDWHKTHKPHMPHHGHHKSNKTVYELIASSKYTTKLTKIINKYPDIVDILNGTAANYTVFAPTDKAFEKLPKHPKPSKELIKKLLAYHVSPDFYPAGKVLITHTIPTALDEVRFRGDGSVAYADFLGACSGRFTWTNSPRGCVVTGQWNTGLTSPDVKDYKFHLEDDSGAVIQDLTSDIASQIHINVPGCSAYTCTFPFSLTSVKDVKGLCFVVIMNGHVIDKALVKGIGE